MAAVAARFLAERDHYGASVRDAFDFALQNPKLGRVDQVVGRIDRQKRRANFFQVWSGIVIV